MTAGKKAFPDLYTLPGDNIMYDDQRRRLPPEEAKKRSSIPSIKII